MSGPGGHPGSTSKRELRAAMRTTLAGLSPTTVEEASGAIASTLMDLPEWRSAGSVALFVPLPREPDLRGAIDAAVAAGKVVLLPRSVASPPAVELVAIQGGWRQSLRPDELGVPAPPGPAIDPSTVDLLVVPGLAFDPIGGRIGRGGGFYDRLLEQVGSRPLRVGVCLDAQVVPAVPRESHDASVDLVVTERRTLRSGLTDRR